MPRRDRTTSGSQRLLPGFIPGRGDLFAPSVLNRYLDEHRSTPLPHDADAAGAIRDWVSGISQSTAGETTLDPQFVQRILCEVLGYTAYPEPHSSLYQKPLKRLTGIRGVPDVVLGAFDDTVPTCSAVIELKPPGTNLDLPQSGSGYENRTPVDQAFDYGNQILGVRWVIVSDMAIIRLYSVESMSDYEEFDLEACVGETPAAREEMRRLYFLLHRQYLIDGHDKAQVSLLYDKSSSEMRRVRDGFYEAYCNIRGDLHGAIAEACSSQGIAASEVDLLQATQRLIDRLMFIYYCEDHPQKLIEDGTVKRVTDAASALPGASTGKVYDSLKTLFREVDSGSPQGSGLHLPAYNGELFKDHPIIDHIELPDSLHKKTYIGHGIRNQPHAIRGVWGLHVYDFWSELSEHLLGQVFERSLSDMDAIVYNGTEPGAQVRGERARRAVFYTTDILSDFIVRSVLRSALEASAPLGGQPEDDPQDALRARADYLAGLKVADFACGSGAFLVSAYREMTREMERIDRSLVALSSPGRDLFTAPVLGQRSEAIRECIHGVDILPQAIEIAKLALWLGSVQKNRPVTDLSDQLVAADSLDMTTMFDLLRSEPGTFDLVVGNPPWGGDVAPDVYACFVDSLGIDDQIEWDSWELFLLLAIRALRDGGRLALLLPDSFLYPERAPMRKLLFESANVEKIHSLGPDWFGPEVRMSTVFVQACRGAVQSSTHMSCMMLTGDLRERAIRAEVPLTQVEAQRSRLIPLRRILASKTRDVEVFRSERDDRILEQMAARSNPLASVCTRGRGEEMNKAGLVWQCPSCQSWTTPGTKKKGGGYNGKTCDCGLELTQGVVNAINLVEQAKPLDGDCVPFIDGDDISYRYRRVTPTKWLRIDPRWSYKKAALYASPKVMLRQAGVGLSATLDDTDARCPQSVYVYRLAEEYAKTGYGHEFVLGALLSRTMNYVVIKRFAETDPAKAFAKLTHDRLADLPIPEVKFSDKAHRAAHKAIATNVRKLLDGSAQIGGPEDIEIEQRLRYLWGITPEDGAYINGEFYDLPKGQMIEGLFPDGPPRPIVGP